MKIQDVIKPPASLFVILAFVMVVLSVTAVFAECPEDLRLRAEGGDYNAQCYIGHMYLSGKGVRQDFEKARYWYQRVINQVGADAKIVAHANLVLGVLFNSGKGGKQCYKTAMQYFEIAAQQGYTDAHINIGLMYAKGLGVQRDLHRALYWWQLAEEKGHPSAAGYVLELKKKMALEG
jgi:TPR repeat protein